MNARQTVLKRWPNAVLARDGHAPGFGFFDFAIFASEKSTIIRGHGETHDQAWRDAAKRIAKRETRQAQLIALLRRLEYQYDRTGMREGHMCPACCQFKPRWLPKRHPARWRKEYGHKPDCWLGKELLRLGIKPIIPKRKTKR